MEVVSVGFVINGASRAQRGALCLETCVKCELNFKFLLLNLYSIVLASLRLTSTATVIKRPSVAGAVLQTPLGFIN